jgi:hypothetical protein
MGNTNNVRRHRVSRLMSVSPWRGGNEKYVLRTKAIVRAVASISIIIIDTSSGAASLAAVWLTTKHLRRDKPLELPRAARDPAFKRNARNRPLGESNPAIVAVA